MDLCEVRVGATLSFAKPSATKASTHEPSAIPENRNGTEIGPHKTWRGLTLEMMRPDPTPPQRKRHLVQQAAVLGNGVWPTEERMVTSIIIRYPNQEQPDSDAAAT